MREYRLRHSSGSYLCSYQGCPRASQGFSSVELRQQHEENHAPRFQCSSPACGFWKCSSEAALRKHTAKYHDGQDVSRVPNSLNSSVRGVPQERSLFRLSTPRIRSPMQDYPTYESLARTGTSKETTPGKPLAEVALPTGDTIRAFISQLLQSQQHQVPMGWQATILPQQRLAYIHQMYVT